MTPELAIRMGVLTGVIELQDYQLRNPESSIDTARSALKASTSQFAGLDFDAAGALLNELPKLRVSTGNSRSERLQLLLMQLIGDLKPAWLRVVPNGRRYLRTLIEGSNACQCLDCAGLFDDDLSPEVLNWWDSLTLSVRRDLDEVQLQIGREGEQLTLEHERQRLSAAGRPDLIPKWVAIEDNTLGYDVRSFSIVNTQVSPLYIEVKASYASPPRFFLSRSEWEKATFLDNDYRLYLWELADRQLHLLSTAELASHIPQDQGLGKWSKVEIRYAHQ